MLATSFRSSLWVHSVRMMFFVLPLLFVISHSHSANLNHKRSSQELLRYATAQAETGYTLPYKALVVSNNLTDQLIDQINNGLFEKPLFRDNQANSVADILSRAQGAYPVVVGGTGTGKTSVVQLFAHNLLTDELPPGIHDDLLSDAIVLQASLRRFIPGGMDFDAYLSGIDAMAKALKREIIVYLTEAQFFNAYHASVLHERLRTPSQNGDVNNAGHVPVIIEANNKEMSTSLSQLASLNGILAPIRVSELKPEEILQILNLEMVPQLEHKTRVQLSDDLLKALIDIAPDYRIDLGEPTRSLQLVEDFAINFSRVRTEQNQVPTKVDLYKFVATQTGLPVVPQNEVEFSDYIEKLRAKLKRTVVNQDPIVDGLLNQFRTALSSQTRKHSVAMVMGPTGVGKSYVAELIGSEFYDGNKERTLKLDMTQFMDKEAVTVLFGAANGFISSDTNKGAICEFLDGPGRGGGIIILNEIEKAHADVITRLMELFDVGEIRGGDGRVRHLGHSLIVMTSNKNTDNIMSYEAIKDMSDDELDRRISQITEKMLQDAFTTKASYTEDDSKVVSKPVVQRVDKWYYARPMLAKAAFNVAKLEVEKYVRSYQKQGHRTLEVDDSLADILANSFYSAENGVRQIRSSVSQQLTNAIEEFKTRFGYDFDHLVVSAKLHPVRKTDSFITARDPNTGNEITVNGPHIPVNNRLYDADFRQRLQTLAENLKKEIYGQDYMIETIDSVIKARYLMANSLQPASAFFGGPTGTGKSQVAKLVAKYLFARPTAYASFHMGEIKDEHDLGNIFSPAKGIIGSDQPGELEKFLINNPEGGVLNFSEISNAGGSNPAIKAQVYKYLYRMLDEGYYTNPSGKKYSLANYYIQMDGNDGEEFFHGAGSEASINEIYDHLIKNPEKFKQLLREHGAPDAFIGRVGGFAITRPASGDIKFNIAQKMLAEWEREVESAQPIDITYSNYFISEVAELMYSPKEGARSILNYTKRVLSKIVSNAVLDLDWNELVETGARVSVNLSLEVTKPENPFYSSEKPDLKQAKVWAEFKLGDKVVSTTHADFTNEASFLPQVHTNRALATGIHEMGHALNDFTEWTGERVSGISIVPQELSIGLALGVTRYDNDVPAIHESNRDSLVRRVAGLLAGSEAEILNGATVQNTGRSNDVERAGKMIRRALVNGHLMADFDGAHAYADANGDVNIGAMPAGMREAFEKQTNEIIKDARELAIQNMKENWHIMKAGQKLLMKHHELTGEEYYELVRRGEEAKSKAGWHKRQMVKHGLMSAEKAYPINVAGIVKPKSKQKKAKADVLPSSACAQALK